MLFERKPPFDERPFLGDRPAEVQPGLPLPFARARHALEAGLRALGLARGARVLVPDFTCETLLHPLERLGLRWEFYPVDDQLAPVWRALEDLAPEATVAVLSHTFGQPQDAPRFAELCRRRRLVFVEDNAHGWGATLGGQPLGTFGDLGIASAWKQHPVPHGAFLFTSRGDLRARVAAASRGLPTEAVLERRMSAVRRAAGRIGALRRAFKPAPRYDSQEAFREIPRPLAGMGMTVAAALARPEHDRARLWRQVLYELWAGWASQRGLTPVFPSLLPGAMPLCFPAYAPDEQARDRWFAWGWRHGVDVHSWPTLPRDAPLAAMRRWQRLVCFPLHQELALDDLRQLLWRHESA